MEPQEPRELKEIRKVLPSDIRKIVHSYAMPTIDILPPRDKVYEKYGDETVRVVAQSLNVIMQNFYNLCHANRIYYISFTLMTVEGDHIYRNPIYCKENFAQISDDVQGFINKFYRLIEKDEHFKCKITCFFGFQEDKTMRELDELAELMFGRDHDKAITELDPRNFIHIEREY